MDGATTDPRLHITTSLSIAEIRARRELLKAQCDTAGLADAVLDTIMIGAMLANGILDCKVQVPTTEETA